MDTTAVGVQFRGDTNDGWARVLVDGTEVWTGSIYGTDPNWPGGAFVKYLEISGLTPGSYTIRVENMWDLPYYVGADVPPEEMTAQAVAARAVVEAVDMLAGGNVIHNGGVVTLSIAVAAGADFIRVCLLTGVRVWDTGQFDHGCAADLIRRRKELHAEHIKLLADVDKKHSVGFPGIDLATHIEWTEFYLADALVVSGRMAGDAPGLEKVRRARELATRPILMGI